MVVKYVIITAGGKGDRMGSNVPKQFLELNGLPIIRRTIKAFTDYSKNIIIILVLPEDHMNDWALIEEKYPIDNDLRICCGGKTRFDSVKNGLSLIEGEGLVAIHDAVRPLVSVSLISKCFDLAAQKGNAIPVVSLSDSVREVRGAESHPVDRNKFRLVQTPQVFDVDIIKKAYEQAYRSSFTDDATVVEAFGTKTHLLDGEKNNIKITTPVDLTIASAFLN